MPKLIIMVGNIASGKSTWIKKFWESCGTNAPIILSKDAIRIMMGAGTYIWNEKLEGAILDCLIEMMRIFMFQKVDIIYDETNMRKQTRYKFLNLAHSLSYEVIAVTMPIVDMNIAVNRRCGSKDEGWGFTKEIWKRVYTRKHIAYEPPSLDEGFKEIWRPAWNKQK